MSMKAFPWLTLLIVLLCLVAVLGVGALVTVALQPPVGMHDVPEAPLPPLETRGRAVFRARGCNQCHTVTGGDGIGPTLKDYWGTERPLVGGGSVIADEAHFRESLHNPLAKITKGYRPAMPAFGGSLAESDIVALMAYIKTLQSPLKAVTQAPDAPEPIEGTTR